MNLEEKLTTIWTKKYVEILPEFIIDRGFCYSINNDQKDILITGINPSFRSTDIKESFGFDFQTIISNNIHDNYWSSLKKMVFDEDNNIDFRKKTGYLDILYFREKNQLTLKKDILPNPNGIQFIADQLNLTQHLIEEVIKPKIIIVKNKESSAYWGKFAGNGIIWMGYDLEFIENTIKGDLYKIKGLINSELRIASEIETTNLKNTIVLFTEHITQYTKKEKRPTAITVKGLMDNFISTVE